MSRIKQSYESFGFYGIGIMNNTDELNIGSLWRSAYILGASFIFTVDKKYKQQSTDVTNAWSKIPLYHYDNIEQLKTNLPYSTKLIGVELSNDAIDIENYQHPDRAVYLLGNEQIGLSNTILNQCHDVVKLPGNFSLNVAVTGSIIAHHRITQLPTVLPK